MTREQLERLPKAELHLHLRGAIPLEVAQTLARRYGCTIGQDASPDLRARMLACPNVRAFLTSLDAREPDLEALFAYETFDQFLMAFALTGFLFRCAEDLAMLIAGVRDELARRNIVYAEVIVDPFGYELRGIPIDDVWACLEEGGRPPEPRIRWIVDLVRDFGPVECMNRLHRTREAACRSVVGITLGGSEHLFPPPIFAGVYREAERLGLRRTVHAGEALGPSSVWDALDVLGAERIGHGVRAAEDPRLVRHLAERGVPLEVCPTSNVATGVYPSLREHPLKRLADAGVAVTLASDDPTLFHTSLVEEYLAAQELGLDEDAITRVLERGFEAAFLPTEDKSAYLERLCRAQKAERTTEAM